MRLLEVSYMMVKGWNNGSYGETGAGYGIRINFKDRNTFFKKEWGYITLGLENGEYFEINLPDSRKHAEISLIAWVD